MSDLFNNRDLVGGQPRTVIAELESAVRTRGVRVGERLALLEQMNRADGPGEIQARIESLEARIREASRNVAAALRGTGR